MPSVAITVEDGGYFMDIKAVDGLIRYAKQWPGPVRCLSRVGDRESIGYGRLYRPEELPFDVVPITDSSTDHYPLLDRAAVILAAGDNHKDLALPTTTTTPIVFVIEYTLRTRLRIARLDLGFSLRALKSILWNSNIERLRRRAFRHSAGLQANGTAAFEAYKSMSRAPLLYFDSRLREAQAPTASETERKINYLADGRPLRLAFSGRLEPMKGADHLITVMKALSDQGTNFTFDIFGKGSLEDGMKQELASCGFKEQVRFHGAVPFDDELVPFLKDQVDLFVCCHRQADPSCTYIETLGCGVPIAGYDNAALRGIANLGQGSISTPMDNPHAMAKCIAELDRKRSRLVEMTYAASETGRAHSFEQTFAARILHLRQIAAV